MSKNGKEKIYLPPKVKIAVKIKDKYTANFFIVEAIFFELTRAR